MNDNKNSPEVRRQAAYRIGLVYRASYYQQEAVYCCCRQSASTPAAYRGLDGERRYHTPDGCGALPISPVLYPDEAAFPVRAWGDLTLTGRE